MADAKISQLTPITGGNLQDSDLLVVARPASAENFSVTREEFFTNTPDVSSDTIFVTNIVSTDDTLALSATGANVITASTNGVDRLRIDSDGNVGIGTSSPGARLDVNGTLDVSGRFRPRAHLSGSSIGVSLETQSGTRTFELRADSFDGLDSNIRWRAGGSGGAGPPQWIFSAGDSVDNYIAIRPQGNGITGGEFIRLLTRNTERLRITSAGNVGIGTTSPSSALTVQGTITGTAVTQSATDTTAGRLTKVGDFGLGSTTLQDIGPDFNVDLPTGFYRGGGSGSTNYPGNTEFGCTIVAKRFVAVVNRLSFTDSQAWLTRHDQTGAQTSTPNQIYTQQSILGTVSQSSGVPTGAIIQRGSNANGEFVRYADGTQICTNGNAAITTNPAAFVGTVTDIDGSKLRIGRWF